MKDSYNALDNLKSAIALRNQLRLELIDLRESLSYEYATSWCSDCPGKSFSDERYIVSDRCCKDESRWTEDHQQSFLTDECIGRIVGELTTYINGHTHLEQLKRIEENEGKNEQNLTE